MLKKANADSEIVTGAVIAAGYIPAISPPLTGDISQQKEHLNHVFNLLKGPIVLTTQALEPEFHSQKKVRVHTVESLNPSSSTSKSALSPPGDLKEHNELAVLMLTSGSSGYPKAVCLQHGQIINALKGKIASHQTKQEDFFLNYIGLDHVANMTEIHLHAMYLGAEQTHVPGSRVTKEPFLFLRLTDEHRISYSFATKWLLASLVRSLKGDVLHKLRLSCLKTLVTGGDATPTTTCTSLLEKLRSCGVAENVLQPGFGMTETCAGCTYNKTCPEYEQKRNLEYVSQGNPTQAISMRVVSTEDKDNLKALSGVKGSLQVRGPAVFSEYFNDHQATAEAFTVDGWFKTGDDAVIYPDGHLAIVGRAQETITLNGKDFAPLDFETAVEEADIPGLRPSYTVAFAFRPAPKIESICVLYVPERGYGDAHTRANISDAVAEACVRLSGVTPWDILAVDKAALPRSSLGKISRVKTQREYESGALFRFRASTFP